MSQCVVCNGNHNLFYCDSFKSMQPRARFDIVRNNKLCFVCLLPGHFVKDCRKQMTCSVPNCGKRHTKFIHLDNQSRADVRPTTYANTGNEGSASSASANADDSNVYLPFVTVKVNGSPETFYALLDSGSTNTFVSQHVASMMNLPCITSRYSISTIASKGSVSQVVSFQLSSTDGGDPIGLNNVLVVPDIPARHPSAEIDVNMYRHLVGLPLPNVGKHVKADILIGMDNAHLLMPYDVKSDPSSINVPYATRTYFGWALSGPIPGSSRQVYSHLVQGSNLEQQIENMWRVESGESDVKSISRDDQKVIDLWDREGVHENGHYTLPIPWKDGAPCLPDNRMVAMHRLHGLKKRLEKTGLTDTYAENMQKFLDQGYAERVPGEQLQLGDGSVWYLPHHGVMSVTKRKLRIVYDCSATLGGVSLNNQCFQGPDLTNKLLHVLLRFRQYCYAISADVECMYMQVKIPETDRNALRFLWYDDDENIVSYRMTSHLFGGIWCSSSSTYALRKTCQDKHTSELVKDVILRSFYVDDLLCSMETSMQVR